MSPDQKSAALAWVRSGENDWVASTASGAAAGYAGPRFAFVEPAPNASFNQRFALNIDLSFAHRLTLSKPARATGVLSRETTFYRLAVRARYASEPQAGDAAFDRRIHAALDDAEAGRALIAQPEARRLILDLFDLGVKRIVADHRGLGVKLRYVQSPAMDGGQALSAVATRLDALAELWPRETTTGFGLAWRMSGPGMALDRVVDWIWPRTEDAAWRLPWRINGRSLALAWAGGWVTLLFGVAWLRSEHGAHQIERLGHLDLAGMAALLAVIALPATLLAARRADAHRVLGTVVLGAFLALPFSGSLRVVEVNRLAARNERPLPAEIVDLLESDAGSFAVVLIADRPMQWPLSADQAILAREGRLCATGDTVEGLRGLRYVRSVRVWPCRRLDDVVGLPAS